MQTYPRVLVETPGKFVWFIEDDGALHWSHLNSREAE